MEEQNEAKRQEIKNRMQINHQKKEEFYYKKQVDVQKDSQVKVD